MNKSDPLLTEEKEYRKLDRKLRLNFRDHSMMWKDHHLREDTDEQYMLPYSFEFSFKFLC